MAKILSILFFVHLIVTMIAAVIAISDHYNSS